MTPQELTQQLEQRHAEVTALTALWQSTIAVHCPDETQWSVWLDLHPFVIVQYAVKETARKFSRMRKLMDYDYLTRFASSVMNAQHARQAGKDAA
jgi:hypothetical protein